MITADFHTHTNFSTDADPKITPEIQIQAAIEKGLKLICITDHYDQDYPAEQEDLKKYEETGKYPFLLDLKHYFTELSELKEAYREQIEIRIGVEFGLQPHLNAYYQALTEAWPFDFVIGSTHVFGGKDPYYNRDADKTDAQLYRECFQELLKDIKLNDAFDVVGHIDYVVRYGKEREKYYSYQQNADILDEILRTAIQKGKGIELNTAGLKYGLGFAHPHPDILKRYRELGGEILTIGSDGHRPEHLAYDFRKVKEILDAAGFRYYTIFKDRKPEFVPISWELEKLLENLGIDT